MTTGYLYQLNKLKKISKIRFIVYEFLNHTVCGQLFSMHLFGN